MNLNTPRKLNLITGEIMKKISIHLVLDDYAALKGCANYSTILSGE